ncbi:MAG: hypothetical protein JXX28_01270 [Deltaproteobacteria bacterium]|nr:hypothetical protein [Deltaproteobacteria bacterium]
MRHSLGIALLLTLSSLGGCELDQPCDAYVDYMCDCHDGEEGFDCAELSRIYAEADPDVQDQCAIDLSDQQATDENNEHQCATDDAPQ